MRLRDALWLLPVLIAAGGCGGEKNYVRTSLDTQKDFHRTAHEVRVSDKRRGTQADAQRQLLLVQQHLVKGELAEARSGAAAVLKKDPASLQAHTFLALALERSGDAAEAGRHYHRAVELAPGNGGALSNYGAWLCGQGHAAESLVWLDRAVDVPGYAGTPMALANAGICAAKAGQHERAERDLRRAIELDPGNAVALGALAERAFRAGNPLQARAFSERRLAAAPADPKALLLASQIEQKLGDMAAAARYVARLNAEFPDASEARNSTTGNGRQ